MKFERELEKPAFYYIWNIKDTRKRFPHLCAREQRPKMPPCKEIDLQLPRSFFLFIKHWLISISHRHRHIKFFSLSPSLVCVLHLQIVTPVESALEKGTQHKKREKRMKQLFYFSSTIIIGSLFFHFDIKQFCFFVSVKRTWMWKFTCSIKKKSSTIWRSSRCVCVCERVKRNEENELLKS